MAAWCLYSAMTFDPYKPRTAGQSHPTPTVTGGLGAIVILSTLLLALTHPIPVAILGVLLLFIRSGWWKTGTHRLRHSFRAMDRPSQTHAPQ